MSHHGERPDDFVFVGKSVLPGDVEVTYNEVDQLRSFVMNEYFDKVPTKTPLLSETADKTVGGKAFHYVAYTGIDDSPSVFTSALVHNQTQTSWRMRVMISRMGRAEWDNKQQRVASRYRFEIIGGQLVEATKNAQIIRDMAELSMAQMLSADGSELKRRMYERPITTEDCSTIVSALQKTVKRLQAS